MDSVKFDELKLDELKMLHKILKLSGHGNKDALRKELEEHRAREEREKESQSIRAEILAKELEKIKAQGEARNIVDQVKKEVNVHPIVKEEYKPSNYKPEVIDTKELEELSPTPKVPKPFSKVTITDEDEEVYHTPKTKTGRFSIIDQGLENLPPDTIINGKLMYEFGEVITEGFEKTIRAVYEKNEGRYKVLSKVADSVDNLSDRISQMEKHTLNKEKVMEKQIQDLAKGKDMSTQNLSSQSEFPDTQGLNSVDGNPTVGKPFPPKDETKPTSRSIEVHYTNEDQIRIKQLTKLMPNTVAPKIYGTMKLNGKQDVTLPPKLLQYFNSNYFHQNTFTATMKALVGWLLHKGLEAKAWYQLVATSFSAEVQVHFNTFVNTKTNSHLNSFDDIAPKDGWLLLLLFVARDIDIDSLYEDVTMSLLNAEPNTDPLHFKESIFKILADFESDGMTHFQIFKVKLLKWLNTHHSVSNPLIRLDALPIIQQLKFSENYIQIRTILHQVLPEPVEKVSPVGNVGNDSAQAQLAQEVFHSPDVQRDITNPGNIISATLNAANHYKGRNDRFSNSNSNSHYDRPMNRTHMADYQDNKDSHHHKQCPNRSLYEGSTRFHIKCYCEMCLINRNSYLFQQLQKLREQVKPATRSKFHSLEAETESLSLDSNVAGATSPEKVILSDSADEKVPLTPSETFNCVFTDTLDPFHGEDEIIDLTATGNGRPRY